MTEETRIRNLRRAAAKHGVRIHKRKSYGAVVYWLIDYSQSKTGYWICECLSLDEVAEVLENI